MLFGGCDVRHLIKLFGFAALAAEGNQRLPQVNDKCEVLLAGLLRTPPEGNQQDWTQLDDRCELLAAHVYKTGNMVVDTSCASNGGVSEICCIQQDKIGGIVSVSDGACLEPSSEDNRQQFDDVLQQAKASL